MILARFVILSHTGNWEKRTKWVEIPNILGFCCQIKASRVGKYSLMQTHVKKNIFYRKKGLDLSGEGLACSKRNRFSIYFKGNALEIDPCSLETAKARAGEAAYAHCVSMMTL